VGLDNWLRTSATRRTGNKHHDLNMYPRIFDYNLNCLWPKLNRYKIHEFLHWFARYIQWTRRIRAIWLRWASLLPKAPSSMTPDAMEYKAFSCSLAMRLKHLGDSFEDNIDNLENLLGPSYLRSLDLLPSHLYPLTIGVKAAAAELHKLAKTITRQLPQQQNSTNWQRLS
jgi:hypothetical protein